jgi:hypothetical protein
MGSSAIKFLSTLWFAIFVMMLVFGLAYELQKIWDFGWMVCIVALLGVLLILVGLRTAALPEIALLRNAERFCGRQKSKRGKNEPLYGDPTDKRHGSGDDRPLPEAVRKKVETYVARRRSRESDQFERELLVSSSFNALIRREFRSGNL